MVGISGIKDSRLNRKRNNGIFREKYKALPDGFITEQKPKGVPFLIVAKWLALEKKGLSYEEILQQLITQYPEYSEYIKWLYEQKSLNH